MNPSHLQQLINDKENELTKIRYLQNEAALQREHEARETAAAMEQEVEKIHKESDDTIKRVTQQVNNEADARIQYAIKEMEAYLERRQHEIHDAASLQMEKNWHDREDSLKAEVQRLLESELERQHDTLAAHYEAVIYSKECNTKLIEEDTKQQLSKAEERHQAEIDTMTQKMDEVANAIWNDAREQFTTAADEEVAHSLATTKSQYKGLLDENFEMRRILDEKERDMKEMEDTFQDVASDVNRLHAKEMVGVSDQASRLMQDNDRLKKAMREIGIESDNLRDELDHCKMTIRSLEFKSNEQMKIMDTVDTSKSESSTLRGSHLQ